MLPSDESTLFGPLVIELDDAAGVAAASRYVHEVADRRCGLAVVAGAAHARPAAGSGG